MSRASTTPAKMDEVHEVDDQEMKKYLGLFENQLRERSIDIDAFTEWIMAISVERLSYTPPNSTALWFSGRVHIGTFQGMHGEMQPAYGYLRRDNNEVDTPSSFYYYATDTERHVEAITPEDWARSKLGNVQPGHVEPNSITLLPWASVATGKAGNTQFLKQLSFAVKLALAYKNHFDGKLTIDDDKAQKRISTHYPVITSIWENIQKGRRRAVTPPDGSLLSETRPVADVDASDVEPPKKRRRISNRGLAGATQDLDITALYETQQAEKQAKTEVLQGKIDDLQRENDALQGENRTLRKQKLASDQQRDSLQDMHNAREAENKSLREGKEKYRGQCEVLQKVIDHLKEVVGRHKKHKSIIVDTLKVFFIGKCHSDYEALELAETEYQRQFAVSGRSVTVPYEEGEEEEVDEEEEVEQEG